MLNSIVKIFSKKKGLDKVDNSTNQDLELFKKDKMGNRFYKWKEGRVMPGTRYLVAMVRVEEANMGVDAQSLVNHLNVSLENFNKHNYAEAVSVITKLRNRVATADPQAAYLSLASCYVLMNDEDPKNYDMVTARKKIKIWRSDSELQSFFLTFAYQLIKNLQPTSKGRTQDASMQTTTATTKEN